MNMMDTENTSPASFKTKYIYLLHGSIPLSLTQQPQNSSLSKLENFAEQQKVRNDEQQEIIERFKTNM